MPRLTKLRILPCPNSESRVRIFKQIRAATKVIVTQARVDGSPGYLPIIKRNLSEGCKEGIHQGISGAPAAASTKLRTFRVAQRLIFGRDPLARDRCQTKWSQASSPRMIGNHPYKEPFSSSHNQTRNKDRRGCASIKRGSSNKPTKELHTNATMSVTRLIS